MKEMLFVGRGGQGVVLASQMLADTFARAGYWAQSFPEFTAERRGAPISAFLRWDEHEPIHRRYRIRDCDVLAVVSASPPPVQALQSVRPGGLVILNRETRFAHAGPYDVVRVPASAIARRNGILSSEGRPMGNMAMLGACVRLLLPDGLAFLEQALGARMRAGLVDVNVHAAREGYERCTRQRRLAGDAPLEPPPAPEAPRPRPPFAVTTRDSLLNYTGSWSEERPVFTVACSACGLCVPFCPEGAITRTDGVITLDELHCKGCGICEVVCPVRNAIAMEEVTA